MNQTISAAPPLWPIHHGQEFPAPPSFSDKQPDAGWQPLHQAWRQIPEEGFQPAWARVFWQRHHLVFEAFLVGKSPRNSARKLNERTWETGDVCEIFVEDASAAHYLEIHVTPENQRLQLRFPHDGLAAVRSGRAQLEEFMIDDPDWVRTETFLTRENLSVRVTIPASILGNNDPLVLPSRTFRGAVCRYDYRARSENPILSSTAAFAGPFFHQRDAWSSFQLIPQMPGVCP